MVSRFPVIDPNVQWITVTDLRAITLPDFKALKKVLVVHRVLHWWSFSHSRCIRK